MKKILIALSVVFGIIFIALAFFYWLTPANALPSYLPGYDPALTTVHAKHGFGSFIVGLGLFAFAWFESGKKS